MQVRRPLTPLGAQRAQASGVPAPRSAPNPPDEEAAPSPAPHSSVAQAVAAALRTYERRVDAALTVGAVAFLVVYSLPILWTAMPLTVHVLCHMADTLLWGMFATDLVVRTLLHEDRLKFLMTHPVDVLVVVVPVLRPLRVLRVFTIAQMLSRRGSLMRSGRALASAAALFVAVGAIAELDAERSAPGATITTIGDALWWAISTVTTVGYGDLYPVTTDGRLVAAGLMIIGVSFVGTITATIGAWFVAQQHEDFERETIEIHHLAAQIQSLREELGLRGAQDPAVEDPGGTTGTAPAE